MKETLKNRTVAGFTIIEVMIVLAIAGLIMVIVFLAIPQLQRSQRNNARQSVVNRIKAEVDNFASNNNGAIPTADADAQTGFNSAGNCTSGGGFWRRYICNSASSFTDPSTGMTVSMLTWASDAAVSSANRPENVYYTRGRTCNGEASQTAAGRNYIIMNMLEGGAIRCLDNR